MNKPELSGVKLRAVVIDDEKFSREVLFNYLNEYCPDVEVVASANSNMTAYKAIKKYSPDFILLDIEMTDGKGFDLLGMFETIDFKVIFVTAFSDYAVKAFRYSAVDYLLKPVKIDELREAVDRIKTARNLNSDQTNLQILMSNLKSGTSQTATLVIPHLKGFDVLKIPEIIMCQADGYCTNFYLTGNRRLTSSKNLKHFSGILSELSFIRIHHSYLININHVSSYNRHGEITLSEGVTALMSDSYKNDFVRMFARK